MMRRVVDRHAAAVEQQTNFLEPVTRNCDVAEDRVRQNKRCVIKRLDRTIEDVADPVGGPDTHPHMLAGCRALGDRAATESELGCVGPCSRNLAIADFENDARRADFSEAAKGLVPIRRAHRVRGQVGPGAWLAGSFGAQTRTSSTVAVSVPSPPATNRIDRNSAGPTDCAHRTSWSRYTCSRPESNSAVSRGEPATRMSRLS